MKIDVGFVTLVEKVEKTNKQASVPVRQFVAFFLLLKFSQRIREKIDIQITS